MNNAYWGMLIAGVILGGLSAAEAAEAPRLNGAKVMGVRPGHEVRHYLAVTPSEAVVSVSGLPEGLTFVPAKRLIVGTLQKPGDYTVKVQARHGDSVKEDTLTIRIGEKIQLTPPMGFNSWYCYSEAVSDTKIRSVADAFVSRGLRDHGWTFVNIDDCWQGERGGELNAIQPNERFPDMKRLCDYVHDRGLKIGLYSSPWLSTYAGFIGGSTDSGAEKTIYVPEEKRLQKHQVFGRWPGLATRKVDRTGSVWLFDRDALQWAKWGFDYVKVDWKPNDVPTTKRIAEALRNSGRDIVLSLSNAAPIQNASELAKYAQLWRTTGDIHDSWGSVSSIGFHGNTGWAKFQSPGAFNDPDMLQIGAIGTANSFNTMYRPSRLTREEQKSQFALWCLMSSPLMVSCDIAGMDDFTYALVTNDDLIDFNQDALAIQATPQNAGKDLLKYEKPLADGSKAVGFFNLSNEPRTLPFPDAEGMDVFSKQTVKKDSQVLLAPHGCQVFRIAGKGK